MSKDFSAVLAQVDWQQQKESMVACSEDDVASALRKSQAGITLSLDDFKALISPAAETYLEHMARLSQQYTQQRFGKTMQMFVPLYLSNMCSNICTYCGFSHKEAETSNDNELFSYGLAKYKKYIENKLGLNQ